MTGDAPANHRRRPSTLPEAVKILRSMHSQDQLGSWAAQPLNEALWKAHFEAGLWIRNTWVYEDCAPLVATMRGFAGFLHDDAISQVILEALWHVLNGQECPSLEALLAKHGHGRPKAAPHSP